MRKILIPVDGSPASGRALEHVIALAAELRDVHVYLINVQEPPPPWLAAEGGLSAEAWYARHEAFGRQALEGAEQALKAAGLRFSSNVAAGNVAEQITERARALGCTEIVMGTRGMSPLADLVLGSVAARVIHLADVPVTLVK